MRTMVDIDLVKSFVVFFSIFFAVTPPALLVHRLSNLKNKNLSFCSFGVRFSLCVVIDACSDGPGIAYHFVGIVMQTKTSP